MPRPPDLPEKLNPGDIIEAQICPFGSHPATVGSERIEQRCDQKAFEQLVAAFSKEILVDFEHKAETGGDTDAAAWIQALRIDPEKGLMGTFKFTDIGAEVVTHRRLRFLSPVWPLGQDNRPQRLVSVGLTNKPNIPVLPILNREPGQSHVEDKDRKMDKIAQALGLPADATEADITAAIGALNQRLTELENATLKSEAEQVANAHAGQIANREAFIAGYVKNKAATLELLAALKPAAAAPVVPNRAEAKTPASFLPGGSAGAEDPVSVHNRWSAMPHGPEKDAYLIANRAAVDAGLKALAANK